MPITALPTPPSPTDTPAEFNSKAFNTLGALPTFVDEANALETNVNAKEASAVSAASTATTQAGIATTQAGIATTKANDATTQAGVATTQAGIATAAAASLGSLPATTGNQNKSVFVNANGDALEYKTAADARALINLGNVDNTRDADKPISTAAQNALNVVCAARVIGLIGSVNSTTPLTKFDLSANSVVLRNADGATYTRYNTGTLICDLGLAGSAANGRDQSSAFSANSWIYIYFIWNGTTLATLASATPPSSFTGSTLPSGYTHWVFAMIIRWNGASNIIPCFIRGSKVSYKAAQTALNVGSAATYTAVSIASLVPPEALNVDINSRVDNSSTSSAGGAYVSADGVNDEWVLTVMVANGANASYANNQINVPNVGQQVYYKVSGTVLSLYLHGFTVPNGG